MKYALFVGGRITKKTVEQVGVALRANPLLTKADLVRMAMEDYMPRYVAKGERGEDAKLAMVNHAASIDPTFKAAICKRANEVLKARVREGIRQGRAA